MKETISLFVYNHFLRPYHNWRIRRMWRDDPNRPTICPQAGMLTREHLAWARDCFDKVEKEKESQKDLQWLGNHIDKASSDVAT